MNSLLPLWGLAGISIVTASLVAIIALRLRRYIWSSTTVLKTLEDRINRTEGNVNSIGTSLSREIRESATETQNAVYLGGLGLRFPVFPGGWAIDTFHGKFLVQTLIEQKPKTIVELGSGTSTVLIARTLQLMGIDDASHIAVDHETKYLGLSKEYARLNGIENRVAWLECPLRRYENLDKLWYGGLVEQLGGKKIDLLIIDGPPGPIQKHSRYPALPLLMPFLNEHCIVVLDDASRDEEQEIARMWVEEYPDFALSFNLEGHGMAVLTR